MKPLPLSHVVILFLITSALQSDAQETSADPRLKAILEQVAALREAVVTQKEERTQKYLADLEVLKKKIQATGDLDKVLQVVTERKAWATDTPTPSIDPKDESFILDLRKLRYYFDQDVATIAAEAQEKSAQQRAAIEQRFVELEKALTTEGKIPQALEARKLREQFASGALEGQLPEAGKTGPAEEKPAVAEMPKAPLKDTVDQVTFPLPDPQGYPPLPTEKGRLVLIKFPESNQNFDDRALKQIESDDFEDLVALSENMAPNMIGAIRADTHPVCWKANGEKIDPRNVSAVKLWIGIGDGIDLMWVDDEGKVGSMGANAEFEKDLKDLGKVRYISPTGQFAFVIDDSGERHLVGPAKEQPNVSRALHGKDSIVSVKFGGPNYVMILNKDGSVVEFLKDKAPVTLAPPQSCRNLLDYGCAVTASGGFSGFGLRQNLRGLLNEPEDSVVEVNSFAGFSQTIRMKSGKCLVLWRNKLQWERLEKIEQALSGAIDMHLSGAGITAILPASSVPRSGLWDVDELIAARK